MIVEWLMIILLINLIWFLPLIEQWNLSDIINDKVFPKVKINRKMRLFFKAIGGQSISTHGIIKALLFLQVKGYALSVCSMILIIILWKITNSSVLCLGIMSIVLFFSMILDAVIIVVLMFISKRRSSDK